MNAQRCFNINNTDKKKSTEKLSSGYKINRAADDAAGLAISEKMRRQIKGLTQGTRNTQDGISMCQIADGALNEVSDMMHRLTELSIQSANDTNDSQDRQAIQQEVHELLQEIDRVSDTTTFNEIPILKMQTITVGNPMTRDEAINELSSGQLRTVANDIKDIEGNIILSKNAANALLANMVCYYEVSKLHDEYTQGLLQYDGQNGTQTVKTANVMKIFADAAEQWGKWKEADISDVIDTKRELASKYKQATAAYDPGPESRPGYNRDNANLYAVDFSHEGYIYNSNTFCQKLGGIGESGRDFTSGLYYLGFVAMDAASYYYDNREHSYERRREEMLFNDSLNNLLSSMKKIPSEDQQNVDDTLSVLAASLSDKSSIADLYAYLRGGGITVSNHTNIWIQSGAEVGDGIMLDFESVNTGILGIGGLNVSTHSGAEDAISNVKSALGILSGIRSNIGAQQNRLEHTIKHQENTIENTTAAESAIRDTDMAKEMMKFSNLTVIEQAGNYMMAQANQSKQSVLSLLQ